MQDAEGNSTVISEYMKSGDITLTRDLAAGTYYLQFRHFDGTGVFSFKTTFKDAKETYTFANNSANEVRSKAPVPFSKVINGQIAVNDDADYFKVTIPKKGSYTIKLSSAVDQIILGIRDKNDNYIEDYYHYKGTALYRVTLSKGVHYFHCKK